MNINSQRCPPCTLFPVILCFLLHISHITNAQIAINIQVSESNVVTARATGQSEANLNAKNKELFHITDEMLKKALLTLTGLETFYLDDDVDIYKYYKLEPVKAILKPNGTQVLHVLKEEIALNNLKIFNHDEFETSQSITLTGNVEDNVTCVYKQKEVFSAEISRTIDVNTIGKVWSMKSNFGRDISETQSIPIANASFTVHLGPKKEATAILSATKVTIITQINYIAILTGNLLTKFDSSYIWGYEHYDIKTIMDEAEMPHSVRLSEEITIEFYTDCAIKVYGEKVYPTSNVNQCFLTVINKTNEPDVNWNMAKLQQRNFPKAYKPQGNSAIRNTVTIIIVYISLFMVIQ